MDCCINKCMIPLSTPTKIIIKPKNQTFINGLARSYSEIFPQELSKKISETSFKKCIQDINEIIENCWPCVFAYYFGYLCCLCTFGLSFCIPSCCIDDAEQTVLSYLEGQNKNDFKEFGLKISLLKRCSTSWLEIEILQDNENKIDNI